MTAAGRPDYDASIRLAGIGAEEPIFVLKAGDVCAPEAVRAWAAVAHAKGTPVEALELALQQADRMEAWPARKAPDGPVLDEAARKQLRYQFDRRAWLMRDAVPTMDTAMAEQLGRSAVVGQLRPVVSALAGALSEGTDLRPALARLFGLVGRALPPEVTDRLANAPEA